jgi:hypothetical protein
VCGLDVQCLWSGHTPKAPTAGPYGARLRRGRSQSRLTVAAAMTSARISSLSRPSSGRA